MVIETSTGLLKLKLLKSYQKEANENMLQFGDNENVFDWL